MRGGVNTIKYWNTVYKKDMNNSDVSKKDYYINAFEKTTGLIPNGINVLNVACGMVIF